MVEVVLVQEASDGVVTDDLWPLYRSVFGGFDDLIRRSRQTGSVGTSSW